MQESRITTFYDMVEYLLHYGGMDAQQGTVEDCRRAIVNGLREFCASFSWSFLNCRGRLVTVPAYTTGTISYVDATRAVTLSGGVWPTWAAFGSIRLNQIPYEVASRDSGTQLTLAKRTPVGADIAGPLTFLLYRDTYPFPVDYQSCNDMIEYITGYICKYATNASWLEVGRSWRGSQGKPVIFSVASDPHYLQTLSARFHPIPDNAYSFDFIYKRLPRYIVIPDTSSGTVAVTAGNAQVVGTGTAWASRHVGSIIRFGTLGDKLPPTSLTGAYPYTYERTIAAVTDAATLTLDETLPETLTNVFYRISDPIDVEEGACMTAFHRECEKQIRLIRRMRPLSDSDNSESKEYDRAYIRAREADKRGMGTVVAGQQGPYRQRISDMPFQSGLP